VLRNEEEEEFMARSGKNRLFTLGEPVVLACGAWEGKPKYIHENEAIFDEATSTYFERRCYASRKE
jgi:hypothetical protein